MKILLFGKRGQVGWELQRSLAPLGQVVALDCEGDGSLCGDFNLLFLLVSIDDGLFLINFSLFDLIYLNNFHLLFSC